MQQMQQMQNLVTFGNFKNLNGGKAFISSESGAKIGKYSGKEGSVLDVASVKKMPKWATEMQAGMKPNEPKPIRERSPSPEGPKQREEPSP